MKKEIIPTTYGFDKVDKRECFFHEVLKYAA